MIDFSNVKKISVPEGNVKKIVSGDKLLWKGGYTNLVTSSIDKDGSIFSGVGYVDGYRLNSRGELTSASGSAASGFVSITGGDVIRIGGIEWLGTGTQVRYIAFYDENFTYLGAYTNQPAYYGICSSSNISATLVGDITVITIPSESRIKYFRVSGVGNGSDMIITVNEEIHD